MQKALCIESDGLWLPSPTFGWMPALVWRLVQSERLWASALLIPRLSACNQALTLTLVKQRHSQTLACSEDQTPIVINKGTQICTQPPRAHTHARTHTHAHRHTYTHAHAHTHTLTTSAEFKGVRECAPVASK
eukprot:1120977-Pelagomonas_calceolata.AAC.6